MNQFEKPPHANSQMVRAYCGNCGGERNCVVHAEAENIETVGVHQSSHKYRLMCCAGCDFFFCMSVFTPDEEFEVRDAETGEFSKARQSISYLPAITRRIRPDWLGSSSYFSGWDGNAERLHHTLLEVYDALDAGLLILAAIGMRTALETLTSFYGVRSDLSFPDKLAALSTKKADSPAIFIPEEARALGVLVEAGNAAAHRGWSPSPQALSDLMDLLEPIIYRACIEDIQTIMISYGVEEHRSSIPVRKRSKGAAETSCERAAHKQKEANADRHTRKQANAEAHREEQAKLKD